MSVRLTAERVGDGTGSEYGIMVVEFEGHREMPAEALLVEQLQDARLESSFVGFVESEGRAIDAMVMRMRSDRGSWRLDRSVAATQLAVAHRQLIQNHLPTYSALFHLGVGAIIRTDCEPPFARSMRHAGQEVSRQIVDAGGGPARDGLASAVDRWLVDNLSHYLTQDFDLVMTAVLPRVLPLLRARAPYVRARLPRVDSADSS